MLRLVKDIRLHWTSRRKYLCTQLLYVELGSQRSQWWLFLAYSWIFNVVIDECIINNTFHNNVVAFHNNVVSAVYDEIIFHVELNISVVGIVRVDNVSA